MKNAPEELLKQARFDLPEDLIARYPSEKRGGSKLLVMRDGTIADSAVSELSSWIEPNTLVIVNETRVSRRRVPLYRSTGAALEALFLEKQEDGSWSCLLRGSGKLKPGEAVHADEHFAFQFTGKDGSMASLLPLSPDFIKDPESFFSRFGSVPIPPYLKRASEKIDEDRYQTVYAKNPKSAAAPTAGLHLTEEILGKLKEKNIQIAGIELDIGYGTFAPLSEENFASGKLHKENYIIPENTAGLLNHAEKILAVGTTALRALESNFRQFGHFQEGRFSTEIFIHPPDRITSVNSLLTNFHLPESSLFLLVCSLSGIEPMRTAYRHAVENGYRFYSYGDAMLVLDFN